MHTSDREYRTELNRTVRRTEPSTRDYLDDEDGDDMVPMSGQASKRYRRVNRADQDCIGGKRRSGS